MSSRRPSAFAAVTWIAAVLVVVLLLLPLVAIFLGASPATLLSRLGDPVARDAVRVTLTSNLIAQAIVVVIGTPAAYHLATHRSFRGRAGVMTAIDLPLVLPPAVAGIALLATFGRQGLLGDTFTALGVEISLTHTAVVIAVAYVSSPFYLRQAIVAFESVDSRLVAVSRNLGAGPWLTFIRVVLPLAARGLGAGLVLSFARGMGEFGATIMFAGSLQGTTQTLPLAIYAQLAEDYDVALALGALLVLISAVILFAARALARRTPIGAQPT